ncbi:hypothetical protein UAJ10_26925 [Nitrospirillum sp. BR 11164]|uniref:hypothetical protein n=1 Tax=Nitrospirillum sp. BR 11164 TaxID=3104324 RepID=UPI002AFFD744|nr:hypothetical protein [Nitrospirillum sp. BR 11164]MEA1652632.1 hypothetical protein [Nitrospirillum sp. BR 11164]
MSLAGIPLLRRTAAGFEPQPAAILQPLIAAAYGVSDPDVVPLIGRLRVVARALNDRDGARTRIAAVHLALPDVDDAGVDRLFGMCADLAKYDPAQPRDWHGRWVRVNGSTPDVSLLLAANFKPPPGGLDDHSRPALLLDAAYNGKYHDFIVDTMAAYIRNTGGRAETKVSFVGVGGVVAIADLVSQPPGRRPVVVEVKTGVDPQFTPAQQIIYPLLALGGHAWSFDGRLIKMGLPMGEPLPRLNVYSYSLIGPYTEPVIEQLIPDFVKLAGLMDNLGGYL